jgi:hypothetical protein
MEGYIKNASPMWRHALKRSIGPGEKIPLDELYEQYGVKHNIEQGKSFVDWLRQVKLRDSDIWEIKYRGDQSATAVENDPQSEEVEPEKAEPKPKKAKTEQTKSNQSPFVKSDIQAEEIAKMSVRDARAFLPKFTNQKVLKYALNVASQLSNKDTLCRMLRKRITELELTRR